MKLGFGGEANWNSHLESWAHCENESKIIKSQSLTTWFKKSAAKPTKAAASLPTLMNKLPVSSSQVTAVAGNSLANPIIISPEEVRVIEPRTANPLPTSALFQSLRNCIATLPTTVPLASKADLFFSWWFCDNECKKNAGWRVGKRRRRE